MEEETFGLGEGGWEGRSEGEGVEESGESGVMTLEGVDGSGG